MMHVGTSVQALKKIWLKREWHFSLSSLSVVEERMRFSGCLSTGWWQERHPTTKSAPITTRAITYAYFPISLHPRRPFSFWEGRDKTVLDGKMVSFVPRGYTSLEQMEMEIREYVFYVFFFKIQKTRFCVFLKWYVKKIENVIKSIKLLER